MRFAFGVAFVFLWLFHVFFHPVQYSWIYESLLFLLFLLTWLGFNRSVQQNQEMRQNQQDFRAILDSIDAAVFFLDYSHHRVLVSKGIESLFDITKEEFYNDPECWKRKVHPDDLPMLEQRQHELSKGQPILTEFRIFTASSAEAKWVQARTTPMLDHQGKVAKVSCVLLNITERKKTGLLREQMSAILESTTDFVAMADPCGRIVYMNPAAKQLLGYNAKDKEQPANASLTYPDWALEILYKEAIPTVLEQGEWRGETALLTRNGVEIPVFQVVHAHRTGENIEYFSTIAYDLSLAKAEEETRIAKIAIRTTLEIQEMERKRLAQELHDGVGQSLYSVLIGLKVLRERLVVTPDLIAYINGLSGDLESMLQAIKNFSLELRPHLLDQLGLAAALVDWVEHARTTKMFSEIQLRINLKERLSPEMEINLYRIIQEAAQNALKHARCNQISIVLEQIDRSVRLQVQDNGIGFSREQTFQGLGLRHMEERVGLLGGVFSAQSSRGEGTIIHVSIPVPLRSDKHD